jgi:hypothetical protein
MAFCIFPASPGPEGVRNDGATDGAEHAIMFTVSDN